MKICINIYIEAHILHVDKLDVVALKITDPLPRSSKIFLCNFTENYICQKYIYTFFSSDI